MTDYVALERRLAQALDRISEGIDAVQPKVGLFSSTRAATPEDALKAQVAALEAELETRDATLTGLNAEFVAISEASGDIELERDQLLEDVQKLSSEAAALRAERDHLRNASVELEAPPEADSELDELRSTVATLEGSQSQLKASNTALVKVAKELRKACEAQVGDADLINRALEASLNALEANKSAEKAELDALRSLITPMLEETSNA